MKNKTIFPQVLQVVPTDDYKVYAYMNDGSVHLYDAGPLIREGTVFEPLADIAVFKSAATVINDTVAWDFAGNRDETRCIDIDPFAVQNSPKVNDPLS
jgi:hypothetical protein